MQIRCKDYNEAGAVLGEHFSAEWRDIEAVLKAMPLHLKPSDQKSIKGRPIFDPVGTNEHIKSRLIAGNWRANIPIPSELTFLGTDVDFAKAGVVAEVQFSNYPFLLNNLLRSELFFKEKT